MPKKRLQTAVACLIVTAFAVSAMAQDAKPTPADTPQLDRSDAAQLHLAALTAAAATGPVEILAVGTTRILEAVIMEVRGRCQWRIDDKSSWKKATIDDRLKPGAMIRTGLKSHLALRCGPNATILVDSNSRVHVPNLAQNGQTLSTIVQVNRGRADFKVDQVGLTNDFSVVTPSGALSVRGTGMGVAYDGFEGTSVHGARYNSINAIEMRYYGSKKIWNVSGAGSSSNRAKNPTHKAVGKTVGRKPLNKSKAMDSKGSRPKPDNGMQQTTRLVLAAERGTRERGRLEDLSEEIRIQRELEEQQPPSPPPPAEPPAPPPPVDDPPAPPVDPPPVDIIDLQGFQSYFSGVVSPTDRGMLAAAIYLDLAPATTPNPIIVNNIAYPDVPGQDPILFRHRIPATLEPAVHGLMTNNGLDPAALGVRLTTDGTNFNYGADLPAGIYDPNNPIVNIGDMYAHIIHHGDLRHFNGWANGTGAPGPMDHDLDVMLTAVNQFTAIPQLQPYRTQIRTAFSTAVKNEIYPGTINGGFNYYGQSLLNSHMHDFWQPPQP